MHNRCRAPARGSSRPLATTAYRLLCAALLAAPLAAAPPDARPHGATVRCPSASAPLNLVFNGNGANGTDGWSRVSGGAVLAYGEHDSVVSFYGQSSPLLGITTWEQRLNLPAGCSYAGGNCKVDLSAMVGGYRAQADTGWVVFELEGADTRQLGPVSSWDRGLKTSLLHRSSAQTVPPGATFVTATIGMKHTFGGDIDGFVTDITASLSCTCTPQVDCSGHAKSSVLESGVCKCYCDAGWMGAACELCRAGYNANCTGCAIGYAPASDGVTCAKKCTVAANCSGHATSVTGNVVDGNCACECQAHWGGSACDACPPGFDQNCTRECAARPAPSCDADVTIALASSPLPAAGVTRLLIGMPRSMAAVRVTVGLDQRPGSPACLAAVSSVTAGVGAATPVACMAAVSGNGSSWRCAPPTLSFPVLAAPVVVAVHADPAAAAACPGGTVALDVEVGGQGTEWSGGEKPLPSRAAVLWLGGPTGAAVSPVDSAPALPWCGDKEPTVPAPCAAPVILVEPLPAVDTSSASSSLRHAVLVTIAAPAVPQAPVRGLRAVATLDVRRSQARGVVIAEAHRGGHCVSAPLTLSSTCDASAPLIACQAGAMHFVVTAALPMRRQTQGAGAAESSAAFVELSASSLGMPKTDVLVAIGADGVVAAASIDEWASSATGGLAALPGGLEYPPAAAPFLHPPPETAPSELPVQQLVKSGVLAAARRQEAG